MQQDTVISWSPPRPSAFACHCSSHKPGSTNCRHFTLFIQLSLVQRVFHAPRGDFWRGHVRLLKLIPCSWHSVTHFPTIIPKTCFPVPFFLTPTVRVSDASNWMVRQHCAGIPPWLGPTHKSHKSQARTETEIKKKSHALRQDPKESHQLRSQAPHAQATTFTETHLRASQSRKDLPLLLHLFC